MSGFNCVIQADSPASNVTAELEAGLAAAHERHYPGEEVTVSWRHVPVGQMWTEGRQSTSSIVGCALTHETDRDQRERYMRDICDLWTSTTGCTDHEVVVAITELSIV